MRWMLQDGLQSVRGVSDGTSVLSAQAYSPYGEQTDSANPRLGIFGSLDPLEGEPSAPLTWKRPVMFHWPARRDAPLRITATCGVKLFYLLRGGGGLFVISLSRHSEVECGLFTHYLG